MLEDKTNIAVEDFYENQESPDFERYGWTDDEITDEDLNAMEKEHYDKIKKKEVNKNVKGKK